MKIPGNREKERKALDAHSQVPNTVHSRYLKVEGTKQITSSYQYFELTKS